MTSRTGRSDPRSSLVGVPSGATGGGAGVIVVAMNPAYLPVGRESIPHPLFSGIRHGEMRHTGTPYPAPVAGLPRSVKPMKAVLGDGLPHDDPDDPAWAYELKWDGMRVLAYVDPAADPAVRLESSNGRDVTASFPELEALVD